MNINISDETIERIVREQVKARVNQYLAERTKDNPYWIWDMYHNCVSHEVSKIVNNEFAKETCEKLCKEHIAEIVIDRFAEKIANCFDY